MLSNEQIEAIAEAVHHKTADGFWEDLPDEKKSFVKEIVAMIASKAIAEQAEQDRRSFIAVGKYIGVTFGAETDVVSAVYEKLDEILAAFREHSQEIAIAQQIKNLSRQLEKYFANQNASDFSVRSMGAEESESICSREIGVRGNQDRHPSENGI